MEHIRSLPPLFFSKRSKIEGGIPPLVLFEKNQKVMFISLMQEKRNQRVHYPQGPLDRGMQLIPCRDRTTSGFLRPVGSKRRKASSVGMIHKAFALRVILDCLTQQSCDFFIGYRQNGK